jgi:hypothetical protein
MAFGKNKQEDEPAAQGRYVVDHVPVMISGKKMLQQKLDDGDRKGWNLRTIMNSDKHDWIIIVWERAPTILTATQ